MRWAAAPKRSLSKSILSFNHLLGGKPKGSVIDKTLMLASLAIATGSASMLASADAEDTARWQTVIGIMQAGNVVGSGTGAVTGGGLPWSTLAGNALVDLRSGRISFEVRGLVLAGGNGIGTRASITQVKGTLVCDTNGSAGAGNSVLVDTPVVDLDEEGNARFSGILDALPPACIAEPDIAFLIRIPAGRWIANGAVLR